MYFVLSSRPYKLSSVEFKEYSFSADVSRYTSRMHNMRRACHLIHAQILLGTLVSVGSLTSPASEPRHFVEAIYYTCISPFIQAEGSLPCLQQIATLSQMKPIQIFPAFLSEIQLNIITPPTPRLPEWCLVSKTS